jgi:glycosyltransferase involved in cell wall biosynthesis
MSQPLRVLLASHRFPPDAVAGVERITQALGVELTKRGDHVSIVTRRPGPISHTIETPRVVRGWLPDGTPLYRLTGNLEYPEEFMVHEAQMTRLLTGVVAEAAPDVVHVLHLLHLSPKLIEIALRQRAALVISLQDYYFACHRIQLSKPSGRLCAGPRGGQECASTCFASENADTTTQWGLRTMYFRQLLLAAHRVICPSKYVAEFFENYGVPGQKIRIIPNAISVAQADKVTVETYSQPQQRGTLRIAVMGTIAPHKGPHVVLDALQAAGLPSVSLYLFGPTSDFTDYVESLRQRAKIIPGLNLQIYGKYEPTELEILLQDMDCVIAPSVWPETFCIVAREALARGIPAIVSQLGALPEAIAEGQNGYTFNPRQPTELAKILQRLYADEKLLLKLREGALQTKIMSQAEHADAVREVYLEAETEMLRDSTVNPGQFQEMAFLYSQLLKSSFARAANLKQSEGENAKAPRTV